MLIYSYAAVHVSSIKALLSSVVILVNNVSIMPAHSDAFSHAYFTIPGLCYRLLLAKDSRDFLLYLSFYSFCLQETQQ